MLYQIRTPEMEKIAIEALIGPLDPGEVTRAIAAADDIVSLETLVHVIRNLEQHGVAAKNEANFFYRRHKTVEENVKFLKNAILERLTDLEETRMVVGEFVLRAVANSYPNVTVITETDVPEEFKKREVTVSVDRRRIGQNYKQTGEIPNGVEIFFGEHLRIS